MVWRSKDGKGDGGGVLAVCMRVSTEDQTRCEPSPKDMRAAVKMQEDRREARRETATSGGRCP